jgi:hypothetical protein
MTSKEYDEDVIYRIPRIICSYKKIAGHYIECCNMTTCRFRKAFSDAIDIINIRDIFRLAEMAQTLIQTTGRVKDPRGKKRSVVIMLGSKKAEILQMYSAYGSSVHLPMPNIISRLSGKSIKRVGNISEMIIMTQMWNDGLHTEKYRYYPYLAHVARNYHPGKKGKYLSDILRYTGMTPETFQRLFPNWKIDLKPYMKILNREKGLMEKIRDMDKKEAGAMPTTYEQIIQHNIQLAESGMEFEPRCCEEEDDMKQYQQWVGQYCFKGGY